MLLAVQTQVLDAFQSVYCSQIVVIVSQICQQVQSFVCLFYFQVVCRLQVAVGIG